LLVKTHFNTAATSHIRLSDDWYRGTNVYDNNCTWLTDWSDCL